MRYALLLLLAACKIPYDRYCGDGGMCPAEFPICNPENLCVAPDAEPPLTADAAPADAIPCGGDAGTCPVTAPICRAGGCGTCENNLECPVTASVCLDSGMCGPCGGPTDCQGRSEPHCLNGTCVQCRDSLDCTQPDTPFCDQNRCRACRRDIECAELCDTESGQCVIADNILYVKADQIPAGPCTKAQPCTRIIDAIPRIDVNKRWIKVLPGTYVATVLLDGKRVTIAGAGDTSVIQPEGTNPVVWVQSGADVALRGVRIRDGMGGTGDGLRCDGNGSTMLRAHEVRIDGNAGFGVNTSRCALTVERSRILLNASGGIRLVDSGFTLRNNFVGTNGTSDVSTLGGVHIVTNPTGPAVIAFNTVAQNRSRSDVAPGIQCNQSPTLTLSSNIVYGNGLQPATTDQVLGNCTSMYSDIGGPFVPGGNNNINMNPMFQDAAVNDFHLAGGSPVADKGEMNTGLTDDIDGDVRPASDPDMGADEAF